jgi:hypothetical protein
LWKIQDKRYIFKFLNDEIKYLILDAVENPSTTTTMSSSSTSILISSHKFVQTESSVSTLESSSPLTSLSLSYIVVLAAAGVLVIGSAIFITSYLIRKSSRRRLRVNESQKFINSNQNLTSAFTISGNYNQSMIAYATSNAVYNNNNGGGGGGGLVSNEYNSTPHFLPTNVYVSSNNSAIELTHRVTQNVTTCK